MECIRCRTQMERGCFINWAEGVYARQQWYPGEPERSCWRGLKLKKGKAVTVTTFRCPSCGHLESYAAAQPPPL